MESAFDEEQYKSACVLVGSITINWAYLEMSIDQIVVGTYQQLGGNKLIKGLPRNFNKKTDYLKVAAKNLGRLHSVKDRITNLAISANNLKDDRHTVTHGAIMNITADGALRFTTFDRSEHTISIKRPQKTLEELAVLSQKITRLADVGAKLARDVLQVCGLLRQ
jgi:hypothetical protein